MPLKTCNKCRQEKDTSLFYANKRMKDGLNTFCIACHKADNVERKAKNRNNAAFKQEEAEYKKDYRSRTVLQRSVYMLEWRNRNKDRTLLYGKNYRAANKSKYAFLTQKRKIDLLHRTPAWLTEDDLWIIAEAYDLAALRTKVTGVLHHVDHIIPLRGKTVSGLHTPNNIRVITWKENQRKTNKFEAALC